MAYHSSDIQYKDTLMVVVFFFLPPSLRHNEAYTWTNPTCCVHNIIVGKLWIEQYGNVEITNHK